LQEVAPDLRRIEVIPNCISATDYVNVLTIPQPNSLIFTGSFRYAANHEAMVWFLRDVYPRIQHGQPNATLMITGDHANLPLPAATGVTLSGHVQDVRPAIAGAWCSIAPLQTGGGTRLKILEAMALGTPVVATPKGAEGLDVVDGVHLLIGDTPETFANAVERVLQEPELRQRLIDNARRLVYSEYEWTRVMPRFLDLVEWAAHDEPMRMEPLR
jgi:glycosyltransferase involved in cell wall biosynthesis